jgi:hypothetical protein
MKIRRFDGPKYACKIMPQRDWPYPAAVPRRFLPKLDRRTFPAATVIFLMLSATTKPIRNALAAAMASI